MKTRQQAVKQVQHEGGVIVKVPASIFRAYDIRGVVGRTLTEEIVYNIGLAVGSEAFARGQQTIIVGRDGRLSGKKFSEALSNGLCATGRDVIDIGQVPTPLVYFATEYLNTGSGVMVTGSHNPSEYNGLKMVLKSETLAERDIQLLRRRIETGDFTHGSGSLRTQDVIADYIATIVGDVQVSRPLKVVIDCGNGVAGAVAPLLLRTLGCELIELYCEVDGRFPNHHPDPSQLENLRDLIATVSRHKADLGLAFDGDGDRLALVDGNGKVIWPDRQMMLYAEDVLARNPGATILFDVKCSRHLGEYIAEHGGQPLMWKTGHSLIKRKMKETGALLAGEMSGHIFFKERWFGFDDAMYTAARLLEVLAAERRSVAEVFRSLPDAVSTPELRVDLAEGQQSVFMARLLEMGDIKGAVLTTIDGLRADFEDGWGLVRASNTTPSLILRFEANTEAALKRIKDEFRALMRKVDPRVKLPF
jgi:phosphomannomutase / phosphoglucomutase